ncbi:MAG: hypothetical protein O7H41_14600 [Planctomycetota bacterium]|nr:hypothetical protein [Planctomycetota bacterium]
MRFGSIRWPARGIRSTLFLLATLLSQFGTGCGYIAIAAIAASSGGGSSGRASNAAPSVSIDAPVRSELTVEIPYRLSDPEMQPADITVEYAVVPYPGTGNPMAPWLPCTEAGGDGTIDLVTSDTGIPYMFIWDSAADLPGGAEFVRVRITPQDSRSPNLIGLMEETTNFPAWDEAPAATITTPSGTQNDLVRIDYTLVDSTDDLVDIQVDYSLDLGGSWQPVTQIPVGETTNLTSSRAGEPHTFAWDSDAQGLANEPTVRVRIVPCDSPDGAIQVCALPPFAETGDFFVENDPAPIVFISSPVSGQVIGGDVQLDYLVIDEDSDLVSILVEYSIDDGVTWFLATECLACINPPSGGTVGLATSPGGIAHVFRWASASATDLMDTDIPPTLAAPPLQMRITAMDASGLTTSLPTMGLLLDNNSEPSAAVSTPPSPQTLGDVTISYMLTDTGSDPVDIDLEYTLDGGQNWMAATERVGLPSEGTTALPSDPGGIPHTFVWDTATTDLAGVLAPTVVVRIRPRDNPDSRLGEGPTAFTDVFLVDNTVAPGAAIAAVPAIVSGVVLVDYTLTDLESNPIDIDPSFSINGPAGPFSPATRALGQGEGVAGLSSSVGGDLHTFAWDTLADMGTARETNVVLRIIPSDTKTGAPAVSGVFEVDNNSAPVAVVETPVGVQSGNVIITYTLFDTNSDPVSILVEWSTDSGTTYAPLPASECTACVSPASDGIAGLASSPVGSGHIFVWDSIADISLTSTSAARIRITPSDSVLGGQAESGVFSIDNGSLVPIVLIDPMSRSYSFDVFVQYRLLDGNASLATLDVSFSTDGITFLPVTNIKSTDDGTPSGSMITGQTTSSGGVIHNLVWEASLDIGPMAQGGIQVRIAPSDIDGTGIDDSSNVFVVGNDDPMVTITSPAGGIVGSLIPVEFSLFDSTSDPIDVAADYSTNAGVDWFGATIQVGGKTNLPSDPLGTSHSFAWNSVADLGIGNFTAVQFRITPTDDEPRTGLPDVATFDVENNNLPVAFIGAPVAGDLRSGDVTVSYILIDGNSDTITTAVKYSTDGSTYLDATERTGLPSEGTTGLSSSPGGDSHIFVWASGTNLNTIDSDTVTFQITPTDPQNPGLPTTTANFLVNNNQEPSATITTPSGSQVGDVTINYVLFDPEGNLVDIDVLYSTDGVAFFPATERAGLPSEGVTGLSSTPVGVAHVFVWNTGSTGDMIGVAAADDTVLIRIVPRDNPVLALGEGTRTQTDFFTVDNTTAPSVAINAIPDPSSGNILIGYTLTDAESDPLDILVEYDAGSGFISATEGSPSDGISGLASTPAGVAHLFLWSSQTDLGPAFVTGVTIRITPRDTKLGTSDTSNAFVVNNNDAPVTAIVTPGGLQSGDVTISYTLTDTNSDAASIQVRYSTTDNGLIWAVAMEQTGPPSEGTTGLTTSPSGIPHIFVWDSIGNIGYVGPSNQTLIEITASDAATGLAVVTAAFVLDNAILRPVVRIDTVARAFGTDVTITYTLSDGDADPADITVGWRQGGVGPFLPAMAGAGGDGVTGLLTSAGGIGHTFVWDTSTDLPPGAQADLEIEIIPMDPDGLGTSDISNLFIRGNDVPSLTIISPVAADMVSGLIEVSYNLFDSTSDLVSLIAEYSTDGITFSPAMITVGEISNLTSSPGGTPHSLAWNSISDLGMGNFTGVTFRLTPRDFPPPDGTPGSVVIDISNNDLPISFIGAPAEGSFEAGDVQVTHILIDGNSDAIDITVDYSTNGTDYFTATERTGLPSEGIAGLTSSPAGISHTFVWNSAANLISADSSMVTLRITPNDGQNDGVPFTTPDFLVNNNQEPSIVTINPFPPGDQSGNILITYSLGDAESNPTDLVVEYSTDAGQSFILAKDAGILFGSHGTTALSTSPGGTSHDFVWETDVDLPGKRETSVDVRLTPEDNVLAILGVGTPGRTGVFVVDNTLAPTATIDNVTSPTGKMAPPDDVHRNLTIDYRIIDLESNLSSIQLKYSTTGVGPISGWSDATVDASIGDGTEDLTTSPGVGTVHQIGWISEVDLSGYFATVHIAIIATDSKEDPAPTSYGPFVVNNTPVTASANVAPGILFDRVTLSYRLIDSNLDLADVTVSYSTNGSAGPFMAATEAEGLPSEGLLGLSTSAAGEGHIFVWSAFFDLGRANYTDVVLLVQPTEQPTGSVGTPGATGSFRLDNRVIATISGAGNGDEGDALDALIFARDVAADSFGNIYFTEFIRARVRHVDAFTGQIRTIAGNGAQRDMGDGGPAYLASLRQPEGIAVDANRNLYIADLNNNKIRRVDAITEIITTVAGGGTDPNDDILATDARLRSPRDVAVDSNGDIFISEWQGALYHRVRRVDSTGFIRAFAGTGAPGFMGDLGLAVSAQLDEPMYLAIDSLDDVFISDSKNFRIRWVDRASGNIDTYAGNGMDNAMGDGGLATAAGLANPWGLAIDTMDNLYIVNRGANRTRIVDTGGIINNFAGTGSATFSGDGGPALLAGTGSNWGVATDPLGNIHIATNGRIRTVDSGLIINTVAGTGGTLFQNDVPAISQVHSNINGVAVDSAGNVYVTTDGRIRLVDAQTGLITTVAGNGGCSWSGDGSPATDFTITLPRQLFLDEAGGLIYVADWGHNRIRVVDLVADSISTFAGIGVGCTTAGGFSGDLGLATAAELNRPNGITFDASGNAYIADTENHIVRIVDTSGIIDTWAGTPATSGYTGDGGPADMATMTFPTDVVVDSGGFIYIADSSNHVIRVVDLLLDIDTFAGTGTAGYSGDGGDALAAMLNRPFGLAVDTSDNIYVSDLDNHRVRVIDVSLTPDIITTIAGTGGAAFGGDGGPAVSALMVSPNGIDVDATGVVYFVDSGNDRIRRF